MNPDYLEEFINSLLPGYAVPYGPGEPSMPPAPGIGSPGAMTRAPVADPMSPAMNAAMPMDRAQMGNPSPSVVIPAVLDALRRQQLHQSGYNKFADQNQLNEQQRFRYAPQYGAQDPFPIGQEFSSRPPMEDFTHAVPSGRLGALSQLIAGLGGVMGSQAPVRPDPRTLSMSSIGSEPGISTLVSQLEGGPREVSSVKRNPNNNTQLQAGGSKIGVIKGQEEAFASNRQRFADKEQAKTDLLAQRGIARGDAANLRATGLDPRTAALLTAIKGMTGDTGDMANAFVTGGALGGPAAGMGFVNEQGQRQNNRNTTEAFREANAGKNPQASVSTPQQQAEVEKKGGAIAAARAAGGNPQAVKQAVTDTAAELIAKYRKESPENAEGLAMSELIKKHGVSEEEARAAVAQVSGKKPESIEQRPNVYAPAYGPLLGTKSLPEAFGHWLSKFFSEPTGSWGG